MVAGGRQCQRIRQHAEGQRPGGGDAANVPGMTQQMPGVTRAAGVTRHDAAGTAGLDRLSVNVMAMTGAQTDHRMTRDDGWRLLSIGRHVERRMATLADALALFRPLADSDIGFTLVLEPVRQHHHLPLTLSTARPEALLELLVLNLRQSALAGVDRANAGQRIAKLSDTPSGVVPSPFGTRAAHRWPAAQIAAGWRHAAIRRSGSHAARCGERCLRDFRTRCRSPTSAMPKAWRMQ